MNRIAAVLLTLALAGSAAAQEWTRFRGPNGTGLSESKNLPVAWSESDFLWRVEVPDESHSQPVIWGDRLFILTAERMGHSRGIVCIDKNSGKTLWKKMYPLNTNDKHKHNSFASGTCAVDKDLVVGSFGDAERYFVRAWTHAGKELWVQDLGPFKSQHGHALSPILYKGMVVITNDQQGPSFVVALNARTGKQVWKCPRKSSKHTAYGTPTVLERPGAAPELLFASHSHGLSSINPRTGKINWETPGIFDKRSAGSPIVAGNLVLGSCGSGGGGNYLVAVKLGGRGNVLKSHLAYKLADSAPYVCSPLVVKDRVFVINDPTGVAQWFEASTGKVLWKERLGEQAIFFASPVHANGKIYCNNSKGRTVVVEASDDFKIAATNPLGEGSYTTPCIDGDRLYMKTFSHLVCIGKK